MQHYSSLNIGFYSFCFPCTVSPPTVSVALTVDDLLYAGSSLILICTISLDQVPVDVMGITVNSTWTGPHGKLFLDGSRNGRIIVTDASKGADGRFKSTLVITPLHMSDTGNYFCRAGVSHMSEFISSDLGTSLIMINIKGITHTQLSCMFKTATDMYFKCKLHSPIL